MGVLGDAWNGAKTLSGYNAAKGLYNAAFGSPAAPAAPPGALTGPPPDPNRLQHRPDGTAIDPVTGQVYVMGANGLEAQQTPNTVQQSGNALNRATGFYNQVPGYDQREAGAYAGEQNTADVLNRMAMGIGPSVAGTQLAIGQDQAARQQLAQAGGSSGNAAVLNRLGAMANTAQLQSATNQQQGLARVQEQTNAINSLGGLQGNMVQQSQGAAGQKIGAGNYLTNLAMGGEGHHEGLQYDASAAAAAAENARRERLLKGAGTALSAAGGIG